MKAILTIAALAASVYVQPVFAQSSVSSWTGCYIGANAGGGWDRHDAGGSATIFHYNATADGFVGGGTSYSSNIGSFAIESRQG